MPKFSCSIKTFIIIIIIIIIMSDWKPLQFNIANVPSDSRVSFFLNILITKINK